MSYISDFFAEKKNFLRYEDMQKIFGVSDGRSGMNAGKVGDYCRRREKLPPLNASVAMDWLIGQKPSIKKRQYGKKLLMSAFTPRY